MLGSSPSPPLGVDVSYAPKPAMPETVAVNRGAVGLYDMTDRQDFVDTDRGLIASLPGPVTNADGTTTFDPSRFDFLRKQDTAPHTVNPSLWRQGQLTSTSPPRANSATA